MIDCFIQAEASVKDALKKLDSAGTKVLIVVDIDNKLLGTISDGDIRRYILKAESLDGQIETVYFRSPRYLRAGQFSLEAAKALMLIKKIDIVPIVDEQNRVVDVCRREDVFKQSLTSAKLPGSLGVPVIIMAGGKGTRMAPFTKILPKPLIPIGDTPIMENIMDTFYEQGANQFYATVNFKAEMIEAYFNGIEKPFEIKFIREKDFMGTAGSLALITLPEDCKQVILSNCDVMVKADYQEVLQYHREQNACLTILSSIQHYKIPYGVIAFEEGGVVTEIKEKPEYSFTINTGIYILDKKAISYIPKDCVYNMPDLVDELMRNGQKVITYPVNEKQYIDIGQWEEYKKVMEKLNL